MYFLTRNESKLLEKKMRRQIEAQPKPRRVLYYDSGTRDYASAARLIAGSIGAFTEATVLFLFAITGDGWNEIAPVSWPKDHSAKKEIAPWASDGGRVPLGALCQWLMQYCVGGGRARQRRGMLVELARSSCVGRRRVRDGCC